MKKLVLFGAGKIGRSFIGQLFARSGYEVVFVDISGEVIDALNRRGEYDVVIKSDGPDEVLRITGVRGVHADDYVRVAGELSGCDIAAVSVGQKALPQIALSLAAGLRLRYDGGNGRPIDIIIAENMRNAACHMYGLLANYLGPEFPLGRMAGLVETSIGKMVPTMPAGLGESDPLLVYAEPYNTLILDKKGFINPIPEVAGLAPKENIGAWVDRKLYIHNFGHAAAAYAGYRVKPEAVYLYEVLDSPAVADFVRRAMERSGAVLLKKYPEEFTAGALHAHIGDLLSRFRNKALKDTVFRVGCDLGRKLNREDRVLAPLIDAVAYGLPSEEILQVFVDGLRFRAAGRDGKMLPEDVDFVSQLESKGVGYLLRNACGLSPLRDGRLCDMITREYERSAPHI